MGKIRDILIGKKDPAAEAEKQRLERIYASNRKQAQFEGRLKEEIKLGKAEGRAAARNKGKGGVMGFLNDMGTAINRFEQTPMGRAISDPADMEIGNPFMLGFDAPPKRKSSSKSSRFVTVDTRTGKVVKKKPRKKKKKSSSNRSRSNDLWW
jgi:hypothetical protein